MSPWTLRGFASPIKMDGAWNTVKAGSTVQFKFEVFEGTSRLTETASVTSTTVRPVACDTGDAVGVPVAIAANNLRFGGGKFAFQWATPKPSVSCYKVAASTVDGSSLSALFRLK